MTEESKNRLEEELQDKIESYIVAENDDIRNDLMKDINSLRKLLEDIERHEQEKSLKEARLKLDEKRVQIEETKVKNEADRFLADQAKEAYNEELERNKIEIEREKIEIEKTKSLQEEKTNKRDFWLRVASIAVPAVCGLIQIGVGMAQYCGTMKMIYGDSERPTPELKDTIKYCQKAIFRK